MPTFAEDFARTHAVVSNAPLNIIDTVLGEAVTVRNETLARYRELLTITDPTEAQQADFLEIVNELGISLARARQDAAVVAKVIDHEARAAAKDEAQRDYQRAAKALHAYNDETDAVMLERRKVNEQLAQALTRTLERVSNTEHHERRVYEIKRARRDLFPDES